MNNLKETTSGIECAIKEVQTDIYDILECFNNVEGFGKVYKNNSERGVIPEVFDVDLGDYKEVYLDDNNNISFGFIPSDTQSSEDGIMFLCDVKIFFWFNLSVLGSDERNDSEAHRFVITALKESGYLNDKDVTIETGINNVFRGFETKSINYNDIHPYHLFSVSYQMNYLLNKKCD